MKPKQLIARFACNQMDDLSQFLRPAGGGIHTVSTGRAEREALQKTLYGARDEAEIQARWRPRWRRSPTARGGDRGHPVRLRRGAGARCGVRARGRARRAAALWPRLRRARAARAAIVDVGDVFVVPQLSARRDAERSAARRTRAALYGAVRGRRRLAGGAAVDRRARRRSAAARAPRAAHLHARRRSLRGLAGGGGARAPRARALGDRSRRRAHRSAARAAGRADLLRDLGLPRQRAARAGRAARPGRRADLVALERSTGSRRSACASSGPTRCARAAPPSSTR